MSDRKLLEYAAKAAGMWKTDFALDEDDLPIYDAKRGMYLSWGRGYWNPCNDNGNALQLAIKLHINLEFESYEVVAKTFINFGANISELPNGQTIEEATRRAIVRAAAEIGKAM